MLVKRRRTKRPRDLYYTLVLALGADCVAYQGQCLAGSLTGAVASQRVTEALKGPLSPVGNRVSSAIAQAGLTARPTGRAGTKVGDSDPVPAYGRGRLIIPKSPYRRDGLAPRCRLVASWGWSRSQGFGCSPIKAARELGSERRETVWSLSSALVGTLRRPAHSTRGPGWTNLWYASRHASGAAGWLRSEGITAESI